MPNPAKTDFNIHPLLKNRYSPRAISLYEIGKRILEKGKHKKEALKKWSRHDDVNGPPRIGNVHLNSGKVEALIGRKIRGWKH